MREVVSPVAWFLFIVGSTEYVGWRTSSPFVAPEVAMPTAWERRYYRRTQTSGWEVAVLRKGSRPKEWMVAVPDGGVHGLEISHRSTCRASPDGFPGALLHFVPLPVMSDERRRQLMEVATQQVEGNRVSTLPLYGTGANPLVRLRRWMSVAASLPVLSAGWVRWCLRSRARFSAFGILTFFFYEALEGAGLFNSMAETYQDIMDRMQHVRNLARENYEGVSEWLQFGEDILSAVRHYIEPWRLVSYTACVYILIWAFREMSEEVPPSRTSSPGGSPAESPSSTPPRSPRTEVVDAGMKAMTESFLKQQEVLSKLAESQQKLEERFGDLLNDRRAAELRREAESGAPSAGNSVLSEIKQRLGDFEEVLRRDREPAVATGPDQAAGRQVSSGDPGPPPASDPPLAPTVSPAVVTDATPSPEISSNQLAAVISKLKKSTETPQEVFVKCLESYRPEDPEEWSRQFPIGYRTRVAPTFLAEVYSHGGTAKAWAKSYIKDRELGDFSEARDLIPAMAAIDSLILQDRTPDIINSVALERLAKKSYAISQACKAVRSEKDWRKPSGAKPKEWRSKVDFTIWRRLDPSRLSDDEQVFVNRQVEDEIRTEMDRDATLLKARQKLEERGGESQI